MLQGDLAGVVPSETARGRTAHARHSNVALPGIDRDDQGKPRLPLDAATLYAFGHLIRGTEQLLLELFTKGLLSGTTHTCIGQELCQMAVVRALDHPDDVVLSNHRNHGHFLTYSGDFHGLVAEIMGRESGVCEGIGGSQHLAYRNFHSNGVQAGMTGLGVGLALAMKMRGQQSVVACIIGDGTLGEGLTYESLNLASIWGVPMLFVVENNGIAQTTRTSDTIGGSILARGAAFGLHTWHVDDSHPEMFAQVEDVVRTVPIAGTTGFPRHRHDAPGPPQQGRRSSRRRGDGLDPRSRSVGSPRRSAGARRPRGHRAAQRRVHRQRGRPRSGREGVTVRAAARAPVRSPFTVSAGRARSLRIVALRERAVGAQRLAPPAAGGSSGGRPPRRGSARPVRRGVQGHDRSVNGFSGRVISTPISEAGVAGAAIGLALAGYRPIAEVMFADFLTLAMDQLYNHAVKFPGMFEEMPVPMVIRTPSGGRRGYGPTHSQSPEHLMTAVPGLTVVFPSHRHDVGRLLETASIDWGFPVVFFEHKLLYGASQDQGDYEIVPAAEADPGADLFPTLVRRKTDPDLTIVAYGGMLPTVEAVAGALADEDLAVEIVAPSLLQPLPKQTLLR